jgi:hypothetical protein
LSERDPLRFLVAIVVAAVGVLFAIASGISSGSGITARVALGLLAVCCFAIACGLLGAFVQADRTGVSYRRLFMSHRRGVDEIESIIYSGAIHGLELRLRNGTRTTIANYGARRQFGKGVARRLTEALHDDL